MIEVKTRAANWRSGRIRVLFASLVAVVLLTLPRVAAACAVCYGDAESGMTAGMNNGILVLLGIIGAVQIGFVALFLSIRQRARQLQDRKDRFQVIEGGAG